MEILNEIKREINYGIDNLNLDKIQELKNILLHTKGNILMSGIGKCETLSQHFVNLLKSISYKAFFISIQNSSHGDIGCLDDKDICLLFSKSGNTKEILDFMHILKIKKTYIVSITCNEKCKMHEISDFTITLPLKNEVNIGIINIPTNSCSIMLIFVNLLTKMLEEIDISIYKTNHLGGSIGNDLKKIYEVMSIDYPCLIIKNNVNMIDIVLEMTNKKMGVMVFQDENNNIIGLLTDGDIRRLILKNNNLDNLSIDVINKQFYKIENKDLIFKDVKGILLKYKFIPIIENNKCIGILYENLIKNNYM
jgi:arabinose-5-phosphate isomerase